MMRRRHLPFALLIALAAPTGCTAEDVGQPPEVPPAAAGAVLPAPLEGPVRAVAADDPGLVWPRSLAALPESRRADLVGMELVGPGGSIGEVERILANEKGEVVAFTVETGGLFGFDDEEVIVPLNRLEYGPTGDNFITALSEDELEALPSWED